MNILTLWAVCDRFPSPQFVAAWPEGLRESWPEEQERLEAEAKQWFEDFDPDTNGWRYWTEWRDVVRPDRSDIERGEELAKEHGWD